VDDGSENSVDFVIIDANEEFDEQIEDRELKENKVCL